MEACESIVFHICIAFVIAVGVYAIGVLEGG